MFIENRSNFSNGKETGSICLPLVINFLTLQVATDNVQLCQVAQIFPMARSWWSYRVETFLLHFV